MSLHDLDVEPLYSEALYFYVGAGVSRAAGLFGWRELVERVHGYRVAYEGHAGAPPAADDAATNSRYLREFVSEIGVWDVPVLSRESDDPKVFGRVVLLNLLLRHSEQYQGMSVPDSALRLQAAMWKCRPHGILTTNYDVFIERSCPPEISKYVRTYRYSASFLPFLLSNPSFVMKLHGDVNDLGSMVFDPEFAWASHMGQFCGRVGEQLITMYRTIAQRGHIVYLGAGFRDRTIREMHKSLRGTEINPRLLRLALIPEEEVAEESDLGHALAAGAFADVTFATYSTRRAHGTILFEFLQRVSLGRENPFARGAPPCPQASNIRENLFTRPPFKAVRRWRTEPWTLASTEEES